MISAQCSEKNGDMVSFVVLLGDKLAGKDGEVATEIALTRRMRKPLSSTWRNAMVGPALHRRNKDHMFSECEVLRPTGHTTGVDDKFKVSGFPSVVILDSEGALTTIDGSDLAGRVDGLYFSAHWCPRCRGFTPQLANYYAANLKAKGLEIIFVSADRDGKAYRSILVSSFGWPWTTATGSARAN